MYLTFDFILLKKEGKINYFVKPKVLKTLIFLYKMTDATSETGTAYPIKAPEFT